MRVTHALTRRPAVSMGAGLTTAALGAPHLERALEQHAAYVQALRACGVHVEELDPLEEFPDAHFVEDVAVITPALAVLTHPGAPARRGEVAHIVEAVRRHREITTIRPPATLDGGDVLCVGEEFLVGRSERTNDAGARQLGAALAPFGIRCTQVPVAVGLHLKSSVTVVGDDTLLLTAALADHPVFASYRRIVVDAEEEYAANTLLVNGTLLFPAGFPRTRHALEAEGIAVLELDTSEFRKMDGALTCLSLRF